jgi:biotin transport system substrate-specific component
VLPQGPLRLLGPTGGYLMAYPAAAFVTGLLAERAFDRRYWTSLMAMAAGLAVIFAAGVMWLAFGAPAAGIDFAIRAGLWPFLAADLLKLAIAAGILPTFWRFLPPPRSA